MIGYAEGVLVRWPRHKGEVGVVARLSQGGKRVRVRFDDGREQELFAHPSTVERFLFQPGAPVQTLSSSGVGVVDHHVADEAGLRGVCVPGGTEASSTSGVFCREGVGRSLRGVGSMQVLYPPGRGEGISRPFRMPDSLERRMGEVPRHENPPSRRSNECQPKNVR